MQVSVSRRNLMSCSELSSPFDLALSGPLEIFWYADERLDISRGPFANRFENDRAAFAVNQYRVSVESKLFWKAHRLTSACPEDASDLPVRRCLGHDIYQ